MSSPAGGPPVNLGPREVARRRGLGLAASGVTLALTGVLLALDVAAPWMLVLALPAWVALLGLLQAREKT